MVRRVSHTVKERKGSGLLLSKRMKITCRNRGKDKLLGEGLGTQMRTVYGITWEGEECSDPLVR